MDVQVVEVDLTGRERPIEMRIPAVFVCLASLIVAALPGVSSGGEPNQGDDVDVYAQTVELVQQLGDEHFSIRERATSQLIELGLPARQALEEGRQHADREIRYRCERILATVSELDFQRRLAAFAAGRSDGEDELPGWKQFRAAFGDDGEARAFFVEMQKAEPEVLNAIANGPQGVGKVVDMRCAELQQAQRISRQPISLGSITTMLFAAGDKDVNLNFQTGSILCSFCYQADLQNAMLDATKKKFVREMLGTWIKQGDGSAAYQTLALAMRFELKEGLVPAVKILENPGNQAYIRQNAILAIAKLGDDSHMKLLESLLGDESKCTTHRVKNVTYETQIRDVALAAIVIMKKQDPKKIGFDRIQQNTSNVFSTSTVGFENDEKRNKVLAKWKEFKATKKK